MHAFDDGQLGAGIMKTGEEKRRFVIRGCNGNGDGSRTQTIAVILFTRPQLNSTTY